jgi:hypothetical protein
MLDTGISMIRGVSSIVEKIHVSVVKAGSGIHPMQYSIVVARNTNG